MGTEREKHIASERETKRVEREGGGVTGHLEGPARRGDSVLEGTASPVESDVAFRDLMDTIEDEHQRQQK
jgi:hypothetical protein